MSDRPKVHQEIRGTIFQQLQAAEGLIETHIAAPAIIGKKRRVDFPEYPAAALRQLITNAVLHRSYEGELANTPRISIGLTTTLKFGVRAGCMAAFRSPTSVSQAWWATAIPNWRKR